MLSDTKIILPDNLRGRSIHSKVIPTVCNLKNMLNKLVVVNGDYSKLKQWEKSSYNAYRIDEISNKLLTSSEDEWAEIIKEHILLGRPSSFGASVIDMYLVAYVVENYGVGKDIFYEYIDVAGISEKENTAQAIWQVGKGDGVYLGILRDNGQVLDWEFFKEWLRI